MHIDIVQHTKLASQCKCNQTHITTAHIVNINPCPNALNTLERSAYNPSVAVIILPSGPRSANDAPSTDNIVVCATTNMLAQNADVIKM